MRRPTMIIFCCLAILIGNVAGYYFYFEPSFIWLVFGVFALFSATLVSKKTRFIPLVFISILIGIALTTNIQNYKAENGLSSNAYQKVEVTGAIKGDPYWDKDRNYVFTLTDIKLNNQSKYGELKVKTFLAVGKEGNRVLVQGKIFPIRTKPGFQMSYAKVEVLDRSQPILVGVKQLLYTGADRSLNENTANFIKGLLVGARSSLSQSAQDTLNAVGLSHIVAVSGYNLTILVVVLQRILRKRWLWGSLVLSLAVVWVFTFITGGSASIMRAAIMASTFLIASYYGRPLGIFTCISITAAITLLINPLAAVEDIGWQLSFLSLMGIVVLTPILQKILPKKPKLLVEIISVTVAAQLATIPYIMYLFGTYSLLAFVANFILMPIIPILMLFGFVASIFGILMPNFAHVPAKPLSWAVDELFEFLVYLQNQRAFIVSSKPELITLLIWYFCLTILAVIVYNKRLTSSALSFQVPDQLVK